MPNDRLNRLVSNVACRVWFPLTLGTVDFMAGDLDLATMPTSKEEMDLVEVAGVAQGFQQAPLPTRGFHGRCQK